MRAGEVVSYLTGTNREEAMLVLLLGALALLVLAPTWVVHELVLLVPGTTMATLSLDELGHVSIEKRPHANGAC